MSVLLLVLLAVLVVLNGLFVAAEFALVRAKKSRIEALVEEGARGAERVSRQMDQIDVSLSAAQVGITMASIGIGFLGEPAIAELIEPLFGGLADGVAIAISLAIAFTLVTAILQKILPVLLFGLFFFRYVEFQGFSYQFPPIRNTRAPAPKR